MSSFLWIELNPIQSQIVKNLLSTAVVRSPIRASRETLTRHRVSPEDAPCNDEIPSPPSNTSNVAHKEMSLFLPLNKHGQRRVAAPIVTLLALTRTKWSAPLQSAPHCITHVSANARIQGTRSLFFLRFHRALHRGIITRDGASPCSSSTATTTSSSFSCPLRPPRPQPPSSTRDRTGSIYIAKRWTAYRSAPPWKLEKKLVIGCGKRNVALYLLLLLLLVVVVGICSSSFQGNIITTLHFVEM